MKKRIGLGLGFILLLLGFCGFKNENDSFFKGADCQFQENHPDLL